MIVGAATVRLGLDISRVRLRSFARAAGLTMSGLVSLHLEVGAVAAVVFAQGESGLAVSRQVALVVGGRDDEEPFDAAGE